MKSRRPDDLAVSGINGDEGSAGFHRLAKKGLENVFSVTISGGMLFPDERVGSDSVKVPKILRPQRPEFEQIAFQNGLEIKGHSCFSFPRDRYCVRTEQRCLVAYY